MSGGRGLALVMAPSPFCCPSPPQAASVQPRQSAGGPGRLRYSVSIRAWAHMKLIRQIVLTVTWTELKSSNAASLVMLPAEDGSGDDRTGVLNWAVRRAALAERPGIRLPRSLGGAPAR